MEYVALILVCALFAESLMIRQSIKDLRRRIEILEKAARTESAAKP